MSLVSALLVSVGLFILLHALVLPSLRKRLEADLSPAAIAPLAWFKVFAVLRTATLAVASGLALLWLSILVLSWRSLASVETVSSTLDAMRQLQELTHWASLGSSVFWLFVLAGGLCWLTYKQSRQQARRLFAEIDTAERERVLEALKADQWDPLPPTELMSKLGTVFDAKQRELAAASEGDDAARAETLGEETERLRQMYLQLDFERRLKIEAPHPFADDLVLPPSARLSDRLRHFVFNRGVLKSMTTGTRAVAFTGLMLLVPAAGSLALGLGDEPISQHVVQLDEIRIQLARNAAEQDLAEGLKTAKPPVTAPTADDDQAEAALAESFDHSFTQTLVLRATPQSMHARLAQAAVREQILSQYAHGHPQVSVAAGAVDDGKTGQVLGAARESFRDRVHAIRRENAAAWQNLKSAVPNATDFAVDATRVELRNALVGEVFRAAFAGGAQEMSDAYASHAASYLGELARGGNLERANARAFDRSGEQVWTHATEGQMQSLQQSTDLDGHALSRALQEHPPTLHASPHTLSQLQAAEKAMADMPANMRSAQALYGFADLAPGRLGDELRTPAAKVAQALDEAHGGVGGIGGNGGHASASPPAPSATAFNRAYSYKSLRGFSRVGGVLIGRPPESGKGSADIVDIAWVRNAQNQITLTLRANDGSNHTFGPYPAATVLQALTYAADQRPLAVTMITGKPVPDLKVITHPALLDTAIGCRAVAIDRVADEATTRAEYREKAQAAVMLSHAMYRLAWGHAVKRLAQADSGLSDQSKDQIGRIAQGAAASGRDQLQRGYDLLRKAMQDGISLPITAKPEFYDSSLVNVVSQCVQRSGTAGEFDACAAASDSRANLEALLQHFPEFEIWSGVRELPYEIDAKLSFLRPQVGATELWPFDFVLQTAFSRKGLLDKQEVVDETPWEFPSVHAALVRDVSRLVATNPIRREVVARMGEFTVLQRLFRTSLSGQLGAQFPLVKLGALSRELNTNRLSANGYKTPRWNTRDVETLYALGLVRQANLSGFTSDATRRLAKDAPERLLACAKLASAQRGATPAPEPCQFASLSAAAAAVAKDHKASSQDRDFASEVQAAVAVLEIRRALGVHSAENRPGDICPAL